jgi:hypothetical protein
MRQKNGLRSTIKGAWCMSHTSFMQQWGADSKHQDQRAKESPNPKGQYDGSTASSGTWSLGFLWSLVLGFWDFGPPSIVDCQSAV